MSLNCLTFLLFLPNLHHLLHRGTSFVLFNSMNSRSDHQLKLLNDKVISLMYNISRSFLPLGHANTCQISAKCPSLAYDLYAVRNL